VTVNQEKLTRLVLIGPILPYRGGVAQHTTMLSRALSKQSSLRTISFSRAYPSWLYPGESDQDPSYEGYKEPAVDYLIDALNPLTWHTAVKCCLAHSPKAILIPWWTVFWAPCFWYIAKACRKAKIPLIFFCHNIIDHETAKWKILITRLVLRQGTSFIIYTREDQAFLKVLVHKASISFCSHPIFEHFTSCKTKGR